MKALREQLTEAYNDARRVYEANGRPAWDAGRIDGPKQAIEILDAAELPARMK